MEHGEWCMKSIPSARVGHAACFESVEQISRNHFLKYWYKSRTDRLLSQVQMYWNFCRQADMHVNQRTGTSRYAGRYDWMRLTILGVLVELRG
jgi:hypothetical protein